MKSISSGRTGGDVIKNTKEQRKKRKKIKIDKIMK